MQKQTRIHRLGALVVLLIASAGALGLGCAGTSETGLLPGTVEDISASELERRLDRGDNITVLDVRSASEYDAGHIPGSVHIPVGELPGRLDELNSGRPVVCVCSSGNRSAQAAQMLALAGFDRVMNLDDGLAAWDGPWTD